MILNILNELAATQSRLEKEAILTREKNNELLTKVIVAALDPKINYWIKKIPSYQTAPTPPYCSLSLSFDLLNQLSTRQKTGHEAVNSLSNVLSWMTSADAEVLSRIINRDLRCGVSVSTVNKIWKGLIEEMEVMLASTDKTRIIFPAYSQCKFDGMRTIISRDASGIVPFSRNGKFIETHGKLDNDLLKNMAQGEVLDGEFVCYRDGKALPRQISNGILNKAIKGTITPEEADLIHFYCWDIVDTTGKIPYSKRLEKLNNFVPVEKMSIVETRIVANMKEAEAHFAEMIEAGEEGIIVKNIESKWKGSRSKDLCKFKAEQEADLIVVGWELGQGKYSQCLGNLICATRDMKVRVGVGSGFSDKQRKELTPDAILDKIVTVRYNVKIQDEKGEWSLFLPRFIGIRDDKDVANSFEELV
jgi:hypothetical protein